MMQKVYILYILECQDGRLYTGYTTDLKRRYLEHVAGSHKSKFTRGNPPKKIAQSWQFSCTLSAILKLEYYVKSLTRAQKLDLIIAPEKLVLLSSQSKDN